MPISVYPEPILDPANLTQIRLGNVPGFALERKFGYNPAVPNGSFELISILSGATTFRSSASTVRIKAGGDAADDAAGGGAREVTVVGLNDSFVETTEAITTAGASASSATTASFWRVYRAYVSSSGTYGAANTGAITIEDSGGSADMIQIQAAEGQSQYGAWATPAGKTAYIVGGIITVSGAQAADIKMYTRENFDDTSAPVSAPRLKGRWDNISGFVPVPFNSPGDAIPAKSDVWFEASGGGGGTSVSVDFEILIVDD